MGKIKIEKPIRSKKQLFYVNIFNVINKLFGAKFLINIIRGVTQILKYKNYELRKIIFEGRCLEKQKIFKTHHPIFKKLMEQNIDVYSFFELFHLDEKEISLIKLNDEKDRDKIKSILQKKLDIKEGNFKLQAQQVFSKLFGVINKETNKKIVETMSFSNKKKNSILNCCKDYMKINEELDNLNKKSKLYEFASLCLYGVILESYMLILKNIYYKGDRNKPKKKESYKDKKEKNKPAWVNFFEDNHPKLLKYVDKELRNDVFHIGYSQKIRGKYSLSKLKKYRNKLFLQVLTALLAENEIIIEFSEKSCDKIIEMLSTNKNFHKK